MLIDSKTLEWFRTKKGGFSRSFIEAVGISWPLQSGWKSELIHKRIEINSFELEELLELADDTGSKKERQAEPDTNLETHAKQFRKGSLL
jgi:hypothetical protein